MRNKLGAALVIALLTITTACGSGGGDRPSTNDLSKSLQKGDSGGDSGLGIPKLDKKSADCLAKVLEKSKLSDKTLKALVDRDKDYKGTKTEEKTLAGLSDDAAKCAPKSTQ